MATRLPTASRNAMCDALVDLVDGGASAGTVQVRTGAQPASADDAASGTLLATFTLGDPAFGNSGASNPGEAILAGTPISTTGVADGTAGWFRALDSDSNTIMDGSVTATGGGGQLELNTTTISTGVSVEITSGTVTQPAS